jgi:prepilin-type processing-associated H-X9-DG protein
MVWLNEKVMNKKAFTLIEIVTVLMLLTALAAVLFPILSNAREKQSNSDHCANNLRQIGLGFKQYIQDYDEIYPIVKGAGRDGWMTSIQPYVKDFEIFQCRKDRLSEAFGTTDYFYNARLAKVHEANIENPRSTILNGDGPGNAPTKANISQLPAHWSRTSTSPARRHGNGAYYSYADGHVEWHRPPAITTKRPADGVSTFLYE